MCQINVLKKAFKISFIYIFMNKNTPASFIFYNVIKVWYIVQGNQFNLLEFLTSYVVTTLITNTVVSLIFVGINFRGFNENQSSKDMQICGH